MRRHLSALTVTIGALALASVPIAGHAAPAQPAFTVATHREPPQFPKGDYKAQRVRVVSVVPNTGSTSATAVTTRLLYFGQALVTSKWYAAMDRAFGLGGSTGLATGYRADTGSLGAHPTNQQISKFVNRTADAQNINKAPNIKTIWLVYFHCTNASNTASKAQCASADHESPSLPSGVTNHVFGPLDSLGLVMLDQAQWTDSAGHHSLATRNASHEVIEGVTDRGGTGYNLVDSHIAKPWLGAAGSQWTEVQGKGHTEVGDVGRVYGQLIRFNYVNSAHPAHSYGYDYSRIFTNAAASAGGDYSRPQSPVPYYSVTTAKDWYQLSTASGAYTSVKVKGWSVQAEKNWTLKASVLTSDSADATSPCSSTKSRLRDNNGNVYPLSAGPVLNNNKIAFLDIRRVAASTGHWCVVELKSYRTGHEPGGTGSPDAGGDLYHSWIVGFYLP